MGICLLLTIIGGLLFVYFNFRVFFKINFASSFAKIYLSFKVLKKEYIFEKKLYYKDAIKKMSYSYSGNKIKNSKKYLNYWKNLKKIRYLFLIKNIFLYLEYFENSSSFVVEFIVVNNIIKRPILEK